MPALKLFVSHSSKTEENLQVLEDVCRGLWEAYGTTIEILVDRDGKGLVSGHDWEKRLNEWLAECHSAVILFSEAALNRSDWVKKEATILSWRRERDPNFILIPVLLDGLTADALTNGLFGTLRIDKSQCISSGSTADAIVNEIQKALGDPEIVAALCGQTPLKKLEGVITKLLIKGADRGTLEGV
ncbi:MAG: toll/interleukin-1 receptor domain-containing protein [Pseudomonadota bacterium]